MIEFTLALIRKLKNHYKINVNRKIKILPLNVESTGRFGPADFFQRNQPPFKPRITKIDLRIKASFEKTGYNFKVEY